MARNIKINCKRVYSAGVAYQDFANEVREIQRRMQNISSSISKCWQGVDNNNFTVKFNEHINYLNNLIGFLDEKGNLLKNNALNHENADKEFVNRMKRTDFDE